MMEFDVYAAPMNVSSPEVVNDGLHFINPAGFVHLTGRIELVGQGQHGFYPFLWLTGANARLVEQALHPLLPIRLLLVGDGVGLYEGVSQAIYLPQALLGSDLLRERVHVVGWKDPEIDTARRDYWFGPNLGKFTKELGFKPISSNAELWRS